MTGSAHDVAEVLRDRLPGLGTKKLHKLLYYCQGHHLAAFGEPLFDEAISAWDMGPVVGSLWKQEKAGDAPGPATDLTEAELNTIGYVISRYGALTGQDLENLTHSEPPWQLANRERPPGGSARIDRETIREYFTTAGAADTPALDFAVVAEWLASAGDRRAGPARPDRPAELRARLAALA